MQRFPTGLGVVIIDHGSRRQEANDMLLEVVRQFRDCCRLTVVEPAHLELAEPTLAQAFAHCVAQGATHIVVLPYFLSPGKHSRRDIPELARDAAARFPAITYALAAPLGVHTGILNALHDRALEALEAPENREK